MKFLVLFYTTIILLCITVKSSYAAGYLEDIAIISNWTGCVNRFSITLFIISSIVLYYFPESRYYAFKGCNLVIDIVANGLKAALSCSLNNETCDSIGSTSDRFLNLPKIHQPVVTGSDFHRDQNNSQRLRRRHRGRQEIKIDDDKISSRGNDRKKHRHGAERSRYNREDKNFQRLQSQSINKTTSKEMEKPSSLEIYPERTTDEFYYPGGRKDDDMSIYAGCSPKYSTSFVIGGAKIASSDVLVTNINLKRGSVTTLEEEEILQTVSKHRGVPMRNRTRLEDTLYPENDGPTRECENFLLRDLKDCNERGYDIESNIRLDTSILECSERERNIDDQMEQPQHEDSTTTVQECKDEVENLERVANKRNLIINEDFNAENTTVFPPTEGNRSGRVKDATFSVRKVNFQKKEKEKCKKKMTQDDDRTLNTKSEEVLGQLGDQITKLEKTLKMIKPEKSSIKNRVGIYKDDYVLQNIETVLKEMKRSFVKIDEQIKRRRKRSPIERESIKERKTREISNFPNETMTEEIHSSTSFIDEEEKRIFEGEKDSRNLLDVTILSNETLIDDEDEFPPIVTNRIKPYLIRTFDWLFTGCPGISSRRYSVGKDGARREAAMDQIP